jgi:hypothetical protein
MNLSAVRGQYILGTNWWTSVNNSAVGAPIKLIFSSSSPQKTPKQRQIKNRIKKTTAKTDKTKK